MKLILSFFALFFYGNIRSQKIEPLSSHSISSFRGLSVVTDQIIWVSGNNGTVGKSIDGGQSWEWNIIPGFEKRDFRSIEGFSTSEALIMAVDAPGQILRTIDGGAHWEIVFTDSSKGIFLDAMYFADSNGMVVGDPLDHKIYLAQTRDYGHSWTRSGTFDKYFIPEGEAFFASSGTNLAFLPGSRSIPVLATGGTRSRIYFSNKADYDIPLLQGGNSTGANSIAFAEGRPSGIIVGGDFSHDSLTGGNCVLFSLIPFSVKKPLTGPHGYRSCVIELEKGKWFCCGTSGVDISTDGGNNWRLISSEGYHVCRKAKQGRAVYLAGAKGKIARLQW